MKSFARRLAKLEAGLVGISSSSIAILSAPLPADDADHCDWVEALLAEYGLQDQRFSFWIVGGVHDVLLPVTSIDSLAAEQVAMWLHAASTFPHVAGMAGAFTIAWKINSEGGWQAAIEQMHREIHA